MTFSEALTALKKGAKVSRTGWNGKHQYLGLAVHISFLDNCGNIINPNHENYGNAAIVFYGASGEQVGWLASQADMLADDWEII